MQKDYTIPLDDVDVTLKIDDSVKMYVQEYDDGECYLIRAIREEHPRVVSWLTLENLYWS